MNMPQSDSSFSSGQFVFQEPAESGWQVVPPSLTIDIATNTRQDTTPPLSISSPSSATTNTSDSWMHTLASRQTASSGAISSIGDTLPIVEMDNSLAFQLFGAMEVNGRRDPIAEFHRIHSRDSIAGQWLPSQIRCPMRLGLTSMYVPYAANGPSAQHAPHAVENALPAFGMLEASQNVNATAVTSSLGSTTAEAAAAVAAEIPMTVPTSSEHTASSILSTQGIYYGQADAQPQSFANMAQAPSCMTCGTIGSVFCELFHTQSLPEVEMQPPETEFPLLDRLALNSIEISTATSSACISPTPAISEPPLYFTGQERTLTHTATADRRLPRGRRRATSAAEAATVPGTARARHPARRASRPQQSDFPPEVRNALTAILYSIRDNPYPSSEQIGFIRTQYGLSEKQVRNWFALHRCRHMVRVNANGITFWRFRNELE